MLQIGLDDEIADRFSRRAAALGRREGDLVADWIRERLVEFDMADEERTELASWAADKAADAQLFALDAEDGGYDWGPNGIPSYGKAL